MELNIKKEIDTYLFVIFKLMLGFFLAALGIVFMINANLGLSPWDVLHQGITNVIPMTIGQANIVVGIIVVISSMFLGIKIGIGTILNTILVGVFIDLITITKVIPMVHNLFIGILMLVVGMIFLGLGTCIYLSCELGCGPRDGLMTALTRITKKPVKLVRTTIEICALVCGWFLGGYVGIGTIITAIVLGYIIQLWCKILKLDIATLNHRSILDYFNNIIKKV
ncbi:hypothetical protein [Clostridium sp. D53t1_180928_C8]|uniref:YczE/YyaS/YitT family protein n=1 Tax=Clostridium sp. D53t1_180928_C8 TaxID=2787101 RepID=UPI0018A97105|nr:hypothetical protein [Clostridium sp. D53t1_180928_C8]